MKIQHLRIAYATDRLTEVAAFYRRLFDFEIVAEFADHEGFDGVMLGHREFGYHLEFTSERLVRADPRPSQDDCIVFYYEPGVWQQMRERMDVLRIEPVSSHNPYWDRHGVTVEDPDGRRIVLHRGPWTPS